MDYKKYSIQRKYPLLIKDYLLKKGRNNLFEKKKEISHKHFHLPDNYEDRYKEVRNKKDAKENYKSKIWIEKTFSKEPIGLNEDEKYFLQKYKNYKSRLLDHQKLSIKILNTFMNHEISLFEKHDSLKKELDDEIIKLEEELNKLFDRKLDKIKNIDPFKFEEIIADLFQEKGYETETTSSTGDGGIDIILYTEKEKILVQCKRYKSTVSSSDLRTFLGTLTYNKVNRGFFVTTGKFSKEAKKIADEFNIELFDGVYLNKELKSDNYTSKVVDKKNKITRLNRIKKRLTYNVFGITLIQREELDRLLKLKISDYDHFFKYLNNENDNLTEVQPWEIEKEIEKIQKLRNTSNAVLSIEDLTHFYFRINRSSQIHVINWS